ncbi:lipoyl(octanoyl) transferase LipB [Dermabacteraceae bacterium P13264]
MVDVIRLGFSTPVPGAANAEFGLPPGPVPYLAAWELQKRIHAEVVSGQRDNTLLLLEHEAVYTAGKLTKPHERPQDGTPVVDVDRGGKITWHGPHQLVGYPIVRLPAPINVVGFVRDLEQTLIRVCADFGVETVPVEGRSGVWICREGEIDRKVAAIGLRVSKRVTMHGFALNCANGGEWADKIIPCGISDAAVTSLSTEAGKHLDVPDVIDTAQQHVSELLNRWGQPYRLQDGT